MKQSVFLLKISFAKLFFRKEKFDALAGSAGRLSN